MNDKTLDSIALHDLLTGAALLGGGGGGPRAGAKPLIDYIEQLGRPVRLNALSELPATLWAGVVAGIGAPAAATHGPAFTTAPRQAFTRLAAASGRQLLAVLPGETGAMNSIIPALVAAQLGLPLVDADSAGRALPTLGLAAYNFAAPPNPLVLANEPAEGTNAVEAVLDTPTPADADALVRGLVETTAFGEEGAFSTWALQIGQLAGACVAGSVSRAIRVGAALRRAKAIGSDPIAAVRDALGGRLVVLASGPITAVATREGGGFDMSRVILHDDTADVAVIAQNENLLAWRTDKDAPLAAAPDTLAWLTADGEPLSNAEITAQTVGTRVHLLGIPADPLLRREPLAGRFTQLLAQVGFFGNAPVLLWGGDRFVTTQDSVR
ncbi:DUF917 domain-containing protein [Pseudothauera rhizosphaerae]|uniref:DUF917 domain-containing protein n=1 Tax=Pseudothauera rhizosphaerae TaxID=2565932 RepID=A0A4S4AN26_9RHOO|nr:DUF917 domain-containing protein [Pseudothauera rhizosphaerae]THF60948.1 DUF917 domain-containing protein [Pseudothauera rhizosphaerae]